MKTTERLRQHHADLLLIFDDLLQSVAGTKRPNLEMLVKDMSFIEGKLKIHLSMEDKHLYPRLMSQVDSKIRDLTDRYRKEMMSVYDRFHVIAVKCRDEEYFRERYDEFVDEIRSFIEILKERITMEDKALFPLLDGLEGEDGDGW